MVALYWDTVNLHSSQGSEGLGMQEGFLLHHSWVLVWVSCAQRKHYRCWGTNGHWCMAQKGLRAWTSVHWRKEHSVCCQNKSWALVTKEPVTPALEQPRGPGSYALLPLGPSLRGAGPPIPDQGDSGTWTDKETEGADRLNAPGRWSLKIFKFCPLKKCKADLSVPYNSNCVQSLSHFRLFATSDCSPPEILQARILEQIAIPFPRGSSWPRDGTRFPALQADSLQSKPPGKLNSKCTGGKLKRSI